MACQQKRRRSDDSCESFTSGRESSISIFKRVKPNSEGKLDSSFTSLDSVGSSVAAGQNVRVVVRLRPLSSKETSENSKESVRALSESCSILVDKNRRFEFDAVFGTQCTQSQLYEDTAGDMVKANVFKGFNVTILAYGQTGSGKTYTMGTNGGGGMADEDQERTLSVPTEGDGVIPRAVYDLFHTREAMTNGDERVKVEMSYLEIYNEEARDLLCTDSTGSNLHIRDGKDGVVVQNLSLVEVKSPRDVSELMESASNRRATGSTAMNAVSSRSHAICTLNVRIAPLASLDGFGSAEEGSNDVEIRSKLTLVDLAGSERIKRTGAEGKRMKEGISINKGLFVLGQVVSALSELGQNQQGGSSGSTNAHIPYRDSKLTRLLQDSLGGNSRTVMVACVSPADSNIEETINTLRYAQRTRNIKNSAIRNVVATSISPAEAAALRRENQMLKLQLLQAKTTGTTAASIPDQESTSSECIESINGTNLTKMEVLARLRAQVLSLQCKLEQMEEQVRSTTEDALTASLQADKWQLKHEQLISTLKTSGVNLPEQTDSQTLDDTIESELRKEVASLKCQLQEALTDAAVARATAAAVVVGNGDLASAEKMVLASDEEELLNSTKDIDDGTSERLAAELVSVSGSIEDKEVMAAQMNKERECMDVLRSHFEGAVQRLQEEVDVLASEREMLLDQIQQGDSVCPKKASKEDAAGKMRSRIKELESRIKELKGKAAEHKKSLHLRDIAERKCAQLASEIQEDKKRRAALQRKLKDEALERRSEKKAAQTNATRMLRDSQKLKLELKKVKDAAAKQAAVLRRKAAEAISRQKRAAEQQRKRAAAASMQKTIGGTKHAQNNGSPMCQRKEDLITWFEREMRSSLTLMEVRDHIKEHTALLREAKSRKNEIVSVQSGGNSDRSLLRSTEDEIEMRTGVISQLEQNLKELQKNTADDTSGLIASPFSMAFEDATTWNGLSPSELKFVFSCAFRRLLAEKIDSNKQKSTHAAEIAKAVNIAITDEKRRASASISKLKLQHSEQMMSLLEATKDAMGHEVRLNMLKAAEGNEEVQSVVDKMLNSYLDGCTRVGREMKEELQEIKSQHVGMQQMVDKVAKDLIANNNDAVPQKKKKNKKPRSSPQLVEEEVFIDEEDDIPFEDSDDSDWNPETPAKRRKRRDRSGIKNEVAPTNKAKDAGKGVKLHSDSSINDGQHEKPQDKPLESLKVTELRELLRQRGLAVSGKKADLLTRLQSNMAKMEEDHNESSGESKDMPHDPSSLEATKQQLNSTDAERQPLATVSSSILNNNDGNRVLNDQKRIRFKPSLVGRNADEENKAPLAVKLSASAKKRKRKDMADALSKAMMEAEKI